MGHGVAVVVQHDAAAVGDSNRAGDGDVGGHGWPNRADVLLHDAEAAGVALFGAQALINLGGAVGVVFEPADDGGFEGIELARALGGAAARVGVQGGVFGGGLGIDAQLAADLAGVEASLLMEEPDAAVGFVVDHLGCSFQMARRMSAAERTSPARGGTAGAGGAGNGAGFGSRLRT